MNERLADQILAAIKALGVKEVAVCAGARSAPLVIALESQSVIKAYHWFEERSAAFFAIGASRRLGAPTAVVTTSGTAAGELMPAMMESYYSGVPLLAITADRPRHYRGSGAPQAAEQENLFGLYSHAFWDIAGGDAVSFEDWTMKGPAHLNVCFDDPVKERVQC